MMRMKKPGPTSCRPLDNYRGDGQDTVHRRSPHGIPCCARRIPRATHAGIRERPLKLTSHQQCVARVIIGLDYYTLLSSPNDSCSANLYNPSSY